MLRTVMVFQFAVYYDGRYFIFNMLCTKGIGISVYCILQW